MKGLLATLMYAVLIAIGAVFGVYNSDVVTIHLVWSTVTMPLSIAVAVALLLGLFIGVIGAFFRGMRYKREIRALRKELNARDAYVGEEINVTRTPHTS